MRGSLGFFGIVVSFGFFFGSLWVSRAFALDQDCGQFSFLGRLVVSKYTKGEHLSLTYLPGSNEETYLTLKVSPEKRKALKLSRLSALHGAWLRVEGTIDRPLKALVRERQGSLKIETWLRVPAPTNIAGEDVEAKLIRALACSGT